MSGPTYGGQAVIEGVMMRGQRDMSVAVRRPSGGILVHSEPLNSIVYTSRWAKWPFIRGLVMLWDSLVLGTKVLMFSATVAVEEDESVEPEMTSKLMWGSVIIGLLVAVGLFFVAPVLLVSFVDPRLNNPVLSNVIEKGFRLVLFFGYLIVVAQIPDIKRVFAYHGAEHKTINAYEDGAPLEPEVVSRYSTIHPRCGSSFLLIVLIISLFAFLLLGTPPLVWRILSRIILIPVVAGIGYEVMKLGAAHYKNRIVHAIMAPGLAVQRLTTNEPDQSMVEVAIASLKGVLEFEKSKQPEAATTAVDGTPVAMPVGK